VPAAAGQAEGLTAGTVLGAAVTVAALAFGVVEGRVRSAQGVAIGFAGPVGGDPDACRDPNLAPFHRQPEGAAGLKASACRHLGRLQVGPDQQGEELFPTPAGAEVFLAEGGAEGPGQSHQRLITHVVAMGVVDAFEVIGVEEQQGVAAPMPHDPAILLATAVRHEAPVGEPRELIMGGGFLQGLVESLEVALVPVGDADHPLQDLDLALIAGEKMAGGSLAVHHQLLGGGDALKPHHQIGGSFPEALQQFPAAVLVNRAALQGRHDVLFEVIEAVAWRGGCHGSMATMTKEKV